MAKVLTFIHSLGKNSDEFLPYTVDEINSRIADSLREIESGHVIENRAAEQKLLEEFEWLR